MGYTQTICNRSAEDHVSEGGLSSESTDCHNEGAAGGVDHVVWDHLQLIALNNSFDLKE
jgi:hypothetical protein